jgi:hypothetical protein
MISPLYIDPTTGGMGLQILLGFFVGGFVTIKLLWRHLLEMLPFTRKDEKPEDATAQSTPTTATPVETAAEE